MGYKISYGLTLLVLAITGCIGVYNGINEYGDASTVLRSVTAGVFAYGVLALGTLYGLVRKHPWSVWTAIGWALVITYVPPAAIYGYSPEDATLPSAITAGAASALIGLGVVWVARRSMRTSSRSQPSISN